jgi:hypothetical protein
MNQTILLGGSLYGVQINRISSDLDSVFNSVANNNMLSKVNISTCITRIKSTFQPDNFELYISKVDIDSSLDLNNLIYLSSTKIVNINLYTKDPMQTVDLNICDSLQSTFDIPIINTNTLNLVKYRYYKNDSIDIFAPTSEPFTSRCYPYIDKASGFDSTINFRRSQVYQNISATCDNNCLYNGISDNNYLRCSCYGIRGNVSASFKTEYLEPFSKMNQGLIECVPYAFDVIFLLTCRE